MSRRRALLFAALSVVLAGCGAPPPGEDAVRVSRNVTYYEGGGYDATKHRLDVYVPRPGGDPRPVIVFIHGGSWRIGDRVGFIKFYDGMARRLAGRGFVVVAPAYRLAPGAKFPAQPYDVAHAVAWTRANVARYGGDGERLFLLGHSAGAHLAALVALNPRYFAAAGVPAEAVAGVIGLSGPYDLLAAWRESDWRGHVFALEPTFGKDPAVLAAASPVNHIHAQPPPFLIMSAEGDLPLFGEQARSFASALRHAGGFVSVATLAGKNHYTEVADIGRPGDRATRLILDFVAAYTRPKR